MFGKKSKKVKILRKAIKNGTYNWKLAVEKTADRIINYPQALLWK